jgi:hypothetical protein
MAGSVAGHDVEGTSMIRRAGVMHRKIAFESTDRSLCVYFEICTAGAMSAFRGTAGEARDMPRTPLVTQNDRCCYLSVQEMV